jgi:glyoxylase-like metal-dependent hydrolase (beta-lactamase superfamily II)
MNIKTFEIVKEIDNNKVILYPTLLEIKGKYFLADAGYEETFPDFIAALKEFDVEPADLFAILVSHDDIDHIGALKLFRDSNPNLMIYCSEIEEPSITGRIKSERLEQAEQSLSALPEMHRPWALQFIDRLKSIQRVNVDAVLKDCDIIENEVTVIYTPGHTKGHISFYLPGEKTLIANDALVIEDDGFNIANPMFTLDLDQAIRSVERIMELQPERIICYHGGIANDQIPRKLESLIARYKKN